MKCVFCGSEVPGNARFCLNCGKEILRTGSEETIFVSPDSSIENDARGKHTEVPKEPLFSIKQQRILVVTGIIAAAALVMLGIIWGIVSIRNGLRDHKDGIKGRDFSAVSQTSLQTMGTTASVTTSQSETVPTETTLSPQEINSILLDDYLEDTLIPLYGQADLSPFTLTYQWYAGFSDLTQFMPEDRKGIVTSTKEDLNGDGMEEMLVVIARTFAPPETHTDPHTSYTYETHFDGIEVKVFHVVSGVVQEMLSDNRAMVFDDVFMYPSKVAMQICILESGGIKYIYILAYTYHDQEGGTDIFNHEFYEVSETGIHCASTTRTRDGLIYDVLDSTSGDLWGTVIFNIWDGDFLENYYTAIRARLEPFGLDCSFMDSYYSEIAAYDMVDSITSSTGSNNTGIPLSDQIGNIRVITIVNGTNDDSTQTYDIS